jgi:hypothetical protein
MVGQEQLKVDQSCSLLPISTDIRKKSANTTILAVGATTTDSATAVPISCSGVGRND